MSTERIDHASDARTIVSNIQPDEMGGRGIADWLALAQVHATLAVGEQLRIANLIALGQYRIVPDQMSPFRSTVFDPPTDEYDERLRDDIREGLGL